MKIRIISVGKKSPQPYKELIDVYQKRLTPHVSIEWRILPAVHHGSEDERIKRESECILSAILPNSAVILLDAEGIVYSNKDVVKVISGAINNSVSDLTFIIGGAYGVSDQVLSRSDYIWSVSRLVFPHQLMRLIVIEQLYRTFSIMHGSSYHH